MILMYELCFSGLSASVFVRKHNLKLFCCPNVEIDNTELIINQSAC